MKREKVDRHWRSAVTQLSMDALINDLKTRHPNTSPTPESMKERYSYVYGGTRNEGFFARKVVLVEGPTEEYSLPIYSAALEYNMDKGGVSVIATGGKGQMDRLLRVFNEFQVPCYVAFDADKSKTDAEGRRVNKELLELMEEPASETPPTVIGARFAWFVYAFMGKVSNYETGITIADVNTSFVDFRLSPNDEHIIHIEFELDYKKLGFIEEKRKGDQKFRCYINLLGVKMGQKASGHESFAEAIGRGLNPCDMYVTSANLDHIHESQWVKILEELGYGNFKIVELQIPSIPFGILDEAFVSFDKAKQALNEGNYVEVLVKCQDVIDKIGKETKPIKSELEKLMGEEKFKRLGTFKGTFEAFLGLRHEVALDKEPIKRKDAELALHTTLALLNYFARRISELTKT
jgi:hypothetical protein